MNHTWNSKDTRYVIQARCGNGGHKGGFCFWSTSWKLVPLIPNHMTSEWFQNEPWPIIFKAIIFAYCSWWHFAFSTQWRTQEEAAFYYLKKKKKLTKRVKLFLSNYHFLLPPETVSSKLEKVIMERKYVNYTTFPLKGKSCI